jgi:hypothetical protein
VGTPAPDHFIVEPKKENIMAKETVPVAVIVYPDGTTYFFAVEDGEDAATHAGTCLEKWRGRNSEKYKDTDVFGAVTSIRMLKSEYGRIPARANF